MVRRSRELADRMRYLESSLVDLKTGQRFDPVGLRSYSWKSNQQYDEYFRIYQSNPKRYFSIALYQEVTGDLLGGLARLTVFARANNPNVMADPIPYKTNIAPPLHVRVSDNSTDEWTRWLVTVTKGQYGISYYDAYLKFFIDGTDDALLSVFEIPHP